MKDKSIMPNERTVTVKLSRGELCRVLIALNAFNDADHKQLRKIHDKLRDQLHEFDLKLEAES